MAWHYPILDRITAGRDRWLADHPSVERALGAAWVSADPTGRRRIIAALFERSHPAGLVTLIRHFHVLDAGSRAELCQRVGKLHAPLRQVLSGKEWAAVFNALSIIEAAGAASLTYLVVEKLRHGEDPIRERAGEVLRNLALHRQILTPPNVGRLAEAVDDAVLRYASHQHPAALHAWLALGPRVMTPASKAVAAMESRGHPAVAPLRSLLTAALCVESRRGLVPCLGVPPLTLAAIAGLQACAQRGNLAGALAGHDHLLDLPAIRRGLARAAEPQHLLPPPQPPASDEQDENHAPAAEPSIPAMAAWIDALPLPPLAKVTRLIPLLDDPSAEVRLAVARRLMGLADPQHQGDPRLATEVEQAMLSRLADPSDALARLAGLWLLRRPGGLMRFRHELSRCPEASIQAATVRRLRETLRQRDTGRRPAPAAVVLPRAHPAPAPRAKEAA